MRPLIAGIALVLFVGSSVAQIGNKAGGDNRWNITGPNWYETECGQIGFSPTHGLASGQPWREPCTVPVRVCEFKTLTVNYIADPDVPCERMVKPDAAGPLVRTYIKAWKKP